MEFLRLTKKPSSGISGGRFIFAIKKEFQKKHRNNKQKKNIFGTE